MIIFDGSSVADHPNRLVEPKVFHGLRHMMSERSRFQFHQRRRELNLTYLAIVTGDCRIPEMRQQLIRRCCQGNSENNY